MSEADRLLSVVAAYEWAIDVVEAMDRDQALEYLRRVAARQRRDYEDEVDYARIARVLGPARPVEPRVVPTVEPGRVTS